MDREQQLTKFVNVLRRTARSARDGNDEVVERARQQFNRVLDALGGIDESVLTIFSQLEEGATGAVVSSACRELVAYFEDEVGPLDLNLDSDSFREFWRKSAKDIEDVGEFIKQSLGQFQREWKKEHETNNNGESSGSTE